MREAEEFGRDANDAGLGGPRTAAGTRPGTKALERQVHELQGEVDTLRDQLKDAKARIIAETGHISEQPAARHLRRHPKKSSITTTDKENAHTAAASPVFKPPMDRPLAHNPLANDPPPEGHPAVTPFDPTKTSPTKASPFRSRPLIGDSREGFPQPNDTDIASAAARAAAEVSRSFAGVPRAPVGAKSPARTKAKAGGDELKVKKLNSARVSWNAELEAERTYVPSPTDDTKSAAMNGVGTSTDDVELDSPVKSASPDVKRGGRKLLDGGDKVMAASPKKGGGAKLLHREMPKLPPVPANFPEAFAERLKRLEERAETRERYWKGVVREVRRVASEDSAELRKRCQAAVDGKNEQIRHFRERLNAIVATVHEQSLRVSVEGGVGALGALAV